MPNWCNNYTQISGPRATIRALHEAMTGSDPRFFGYMRPEPDYKTTPVAKTFPEISAQYANSDAEREAALKNEPTIREDAWWDWRVQNWGTKWELGEDEMKSNFTYEEVYEDQAIIKGPFDTAWSPACDAFQYFADHNEGVRAEVYYYEPGMAFCGVYDTEYGDDYYDISNLKSEEVKDLIPEALDDLMGISECMAEYESMEDDELTEWYEDGVEKKGLEPHK